MKNGRVTTRKATRVELRTLRKQSPTAIRWATTPRSQLVPAVVKQTGSGGFGQDYGGKYWR